MTKKKILFLHGALGAGANFAPLIQQCEPLFDSISVDFPGHGQNKDPLDFSIENFSDFLNDYISKNFDGPIAVFGYSMGGYIALDAITKRPELFDKVLTLATKFHWNESEASKQISMLDVEKIEAKIPHYASYLASIHPAQDWKNVVKNTVALIQQLGTHPPLNSEQLSLLNHAICVGLGDKDNMVTLQETEKVYKQLKNGRLFVIPNMQHPIEKMNVSLVGSILQDFFNC